MHWDHVGPLCNAGLMSQSQPDLLKPEILPNKFGAALKTPPELTGNDSRAGLAKTSVVASSGHNVIKSLHHKPSLNSLL